MAKNSATDKLIIAGILVAGAVALFAKSAGASQSQPKPNVQTAAVGNRLYTVVKLGQGNYLVSLVSTGGILESEPVNYTFSQAGPLGQIGPDSKIAQLKLDLNSLPVDFHA